MIAELLPPVPEVIIKNKSIDTIPKSLKHKAANAVKNAKGLITTYDSSVNNNINLPTKTSKAEGKMKLE